VAFDEIRKNPSRSGGHGSLRKPRAELKKVAFYIRVSTEEQAENPEGSIRNQEERLKKHFELKNYDGDFGEMVGVYVDAARSGKNLDRPQLQRLMHRTLSCLRGDESV
jgi:hypothetical protein